MDVGPADADARAIDGDARALLDVRTDMDEEIAADANLSGADVAESFDPADEPAPDQDPGDEADTDAGASDALDVAEAPDAGGRAFGEPCSSDPDCASGLCLAFPSGKACSRTCQDDCPDGWRCASDRTAGRVCVSPFFVLCRPCVTNTDCAGPWGLAENCVQYPDGARFCGAACGGGVVCPEGFACSGATAANGAPVESCLRLSGECGCPPGSTGEGSQTTCTVVNGDGSCQGRRTCEGGVLGPCDARTPAAEFCNLADDDCDGLTDEDLPGCCTCGNGVCEAACNETVATCPRDCTACGNGACEPGEGPLSCKEDCCGGCGDGNCRGFACGEDPYVCPQDCGTPCGNGVCEAGESPASCPQDCRHATCGNGICEPSDGGPQGCSRDCGATCGNCECEKSEDWQSCPVDCGFCGDGICSSCPGLGDEPGNCPKDCGPKAEVCNGIDDDGDGLTDEEGAAGCGPLFRDEDGDGFGRWEDWKCLCGPAAPFVAGNGADCDDADAAVHPRGVEVCDEKDNDCNGIVDDPAAEGCRPFWQDQDQDGQGGVGTVPRCLCRPDPVTSFTAADTGDCDDTDASVHAGAVDACDLRDNDCDGTTDPAGSEGCETWYADRDADGAGDAADARCLCRATDVFRSRVAGDCDDSDPAVRPGAEEDCATPADDDCDGLLDRKDARNCTVWYRDVDGDGAGAPDGECRCAPTALYKALTDGDCDDAAIAVHPGADEACNGVDDDCDGATDEGLGTVACGLGECHHTVDACRDGVPQACDPMAGASAEVCDGKDNDCNGLTDGEDAAAQDADGLLFADHPPCEESRGVCEGALHPGRRCVQGAWTPCEEVDYRLHSPLWEPGPETLCDGKDNDCNGLTDEAVQARWYRDADGDGHGNPDVSTATLACLAPAGYVADRSDCDDGNPAVHPEAKEDCATPFDDDCDGQTNDLDAEGCQVFHLDQDGDTWGTAAVQCLCAPSALFRAARGGDCDDVAFLVNPAGTELCNGVDDDCDGLTDGDDPDLPETDAQFCENQAGVCRGTPKPTRLCRNGAWLPCDGAAYQARAGYEPGAEWSCDGLDNDCDEGVDEGFPLTLADGSTVAGAGLSCGTGVCAGGVTVCRADGLGIQCDTALAARIEHCDGVDDDCDGQTDEPGAADCTPFFRDLDQDTFGDPAVAPVCRCTPDLAGGFTATRPGDCNDTEVGIHPDQAESCNARDDDCDGETDEGLARACYGGPPGTAGTGPCREGLSTCLRGEWGTCVGQVLPVPEVCDGLDNDCNGRADGDDGAALDPKGYLYADHPDCENQDGVCAGAKKLGARCQGGTWQPCGGGDYLAHQPAAFETGLELTCDGLDNDCDARTDEDFSIADWNGSLRRIGDACGTGACASGVVQCNEARDDVVCSSSTRASLEVCDSQDNDCDGQTDEGLGQTTCGKGVCLHTVPKCLNGVVQACDPYAGKGVEICDGADNDCDGTTDEGGSALCNDLRACTTDACKGSLGCSNTLVAGYCLIGGTCFADGQANPLDACKVCRKVASTTEWSDADNGIPCLSGCEGLVFSWGGTCLAGQCAGPGGTSSCDDGKACTVDSCALGSGCASALQAGQCLINGTCYGVGQSNPANPCEVCIPAQSGFTWTVTEGAWCGPGGQSCRSGVCTPGYVFVPAGTFRMGSPATEPGRSSDESLHDVTLTRGFYLKATEVTQAEWWALMGNNPSSFATCGATCPVETVSWWDAVAYCNALSLKESLAPCYSLAGCTGTPGSGGFSCTGVTFAGLSCAGYRLPTEAEWEYAARGGTATGTYNGTTDAAHLNCEQPNPVVDGIAWFCGNSGNAPQPVGQKTANPWGLSDMLGNVWEWCGDWNGSYSTTPVSDPTGPATGSSRASRGGAWFNNAWLLRAAYRGFNKVGDRYNDLGLRVARSVEAEVCNGLDDDRDGLTDDGPALCDDGLSCTVDTCLGEAGCSHTQLSGTCLIDGACFQDGQANPQDLCRACHPFQAPDAWSLGDDGVPCGSRTCAGLTLTWSGTCVAGQCSGPGMFQECDDGLSCTTDACSTSGGCTHALDAGACLIGGSCYGSDQPNPANPCEVCLPAKSATTWTVTEGAWCGPGGQSCRSGVCQAGYLFLPGGAFSMGSPASEPGRSTNETLHEVALSEGFYLKATEVTQGEWRALMGNNPSYFASCGDACPVERVSWWDAVAYCNALSVRESLPPCYEVTGCTGTPGERNFTCSGVTFIGLACPGYRLPTEAEWEYAARAGTATGTYNGTSDALHLGCEQPNPVLDSIAWFCGNANAGGRVTASRSANAWGLWDMLGNVWEWTGDWYGSYSTSPQVDPTGAPTGTLRTHRGGSGYSSAAVSRSAYRGANAAGTWTIDLGMRVARSVEAETCNGRDDDRDGLTDEGPSVCDDGLSCTVDTCMGAAGCSHALAAGSCLVGGRCYLDGQPDPANECQACRPSVTPSAWSPLVDGAPCGTRSCAGLTHGWAGSCVSGQCSGAGGSRDCDDGKACTADGCNEVAGCTNPPIGGFCLIGGTCFGEGQANPGNPCEACNSAASPSAWIPLDGAWCGPGGQACEAGQCTGGYVFIPRGTFQMGSPSTEPGRSTDETLHSVTHTRGYYLKKTEVTQGEWLALMGNNPSGFASCGSRCPVEQVNWWDAVAYCNALSAKEGLTACYVTTGCTGTPGAMNHTCTGVTSLGLSCTGYRLPTEAEWEFAARAGTASGTYNGTSDAAHLACEQPNAVLDPIASFCGNSGSRTRSVGSKSANAWGLWDMLGNAWEWTGDWYGTLPTAAVSDPSGPATGAARVRRGGSWGSSGASARAAYRGNSSPDFVGNSLGLRVARSVEFEVCNGLDEDRDGVVDNGSSICDDGRSCTTDTCHGASGCSHELKAGTCLIGGICYADGEANPANACDVCRPASSVSAWSPAANGTPCGTRSCVGLVLGWSGTCISGQCTGPGGSRDCDDGKACTTDTCVESTGCGNTLQAGACLIGGTCYGEGQTNPGNPCNACVTASSSSSWTVTEGNWCGAGGKSCQSGTCAPGYVLVPAGTFTMGSPAGEPGRSVDETQHSVTLGKGFYLKATEVTQGEWRALMGNNPATDTGCGNACPVESVSWWDAIAYCNALSAMEALSACYVLSGCTGTPGERNYTCTGVTFAGLSCTGYRLPTEAEWEYAARAGTTTATYNGTSDASHLGCEAPNTVLDPIAWFCGNSPTGINVVRTRQANARGLSDVLGNVWEWCGDWAGTYPTTAVTDPTGPVAGTSRIVRGGSAFEGGNQLRAAMRAAGAPTSAYSNLGVRPARSAP